MNLVKIEISLFRNVNFVKKMRFQKSAFCENFKDFNGWTILESTLLSREDKSGVLSLGSAIALFHLFAELK